MPQTSDEPPALTIGVAGFMVALGVTYITSVAWSHDATGGVGSFASNWYNYVSSPGGWWVYLLVFLGASVISELIFYVLWRWWHWYS